ncbi:unnamed protein product [Calypogeia fissa]
MQNFAIAGGRPSSPIAGIHHSPAPSRNLPGWQWRQHDSRALRLPNSVSIGESQPGERHSAGFVVNAFFGGSKSPPVKSAGKGCFSCLGKGAVDCPGCKGSGKNKKNGNLFERWKCYDCQGFGMISCPKCGTGGLTPEQRGER